jgi:hypothetical protein
MTRNCRIGLEYFETIPENPVAHPLHQNKQKDKRYNERPTDQSRKQF